jgi:hypothetical protein
LTEDEFLAGCMEDEELSRILSPLTAWNPFFFLGL